MGAWGIRSKESDYGLDLLSVIAKQQLLKIDFAYLNVSEAITLLENHIKNEIVRTLRRHGASTKVIMKDLASLFPGRYEDALLLIAECVADYYRDGEFQVDDFWSKPDKLIVRHVKKIIITDADTRKLLDCLRQVLDSESEQYHSGEDDKTNEEWKSLINEHIRLIEAHSKQ